MDKIGSSHRTAGTLALALAVLAFLPFAQGIEHDFINFDDDIYITANPHVLSGLNADGVIAAFIGTDIGHWHPLTWLSLMLDIELFGRDAGWHHMSALLLHVLNTLLLFAFFRYATGSAMRSAFVAAMFAIHPLHVEPVAWASSRKDVLSTFFFFSMLFAYVARVRTQHAGWHAAVVAFYAMGIASKPMVMTAPLLLLLLDFWPLGRIERKSVLEDFKKCVLEKRLLLILMVFSAAMTLFAASSGSVYMEYKDLPLWTRIAVVPINYVEYLVRMVWPVGLVLFYAHPALSITIAEVAFCIGLLAAFTIMVLRSAWSAPYLFYGWFWYLAMIFPVSGFIQFGSHSGADRYTYVSLVGIFVMIAWGAVEVAGEEVAKRRVLAGVAVVLVAICFVLSWKQVSYWRDSKTLWAHVLTVVPEEGWAHHQIGVELRKEGDLVGAAKYFEDALRYNPRLYLAPYNLAGIRSDQGRIDEAIAHCRVAIRLQPGSADAHERLGSLLATQKRYPEALQSFETAIAINPNHEFARYNRDEVLRRLGRSP